MDWRKEKDSNVQTLVHKLIFYSEYGSIKTAEKHNCIAEQEKEKERYFI